MSPDRMMTSHHSVLHIESTKYKELRLSRESTAFLPCGHTMAYEEVARDVIILSTGHLRGLRHSLEQ